MEKDLQKQFKDLKSRVTPDAVWAKENKRVLLSKISQYEGVNETASVFDFSKVFFNLKLVNKQVAVFGLILIVVLSSSAFTVSAAFNSLPGDTLYGLKISAEKLQLAISFDEKEQLNLYVDFAEKRLEEVRQLQTKQDLGQDLKPEEKQNLASAITNFKKEVNNIHSKLANV